MAWYLDRTLAASNRIRSEVIFPVAGSRLDLDFFYWRKVTGSLLDLLFPGLKQESDCLNLVGTGSGLDSDSQFAKPDWTRTQKNQSPNTSSINTPRNLLRQKSIHVYCSEKYLMEEVVHNFWAKKEHKLNINIILKLIICLLVNIFLLFS